MEGKGDLTPGQGPSESSNGAPHVGAGDCDGDLSDKCVTNETSDPSQPMTTCPETEGECDWLGESDPWNTAARFYFSDAGDIINEGALSDPESIHSSSTIEDDLDLPEDDDFREWTLPDPSDDEEQEELRQKYFDLFKVNEPEEILVAEDDLLPEDADYWKTYFENHYKNHHVNVHFPEKFTKLTLHHDRVTDVTFVPEHFPALKFLDISKNFVQNVRCLGKLKSLVHLNASDNEIRRFLDICSKTPHPLQEVDLSKNQITQIVPFNPFLGLLNVNLAYNRLKIIDNFQHCFFLRFLNLSHNNISEISNLDCPNLLVLLLQDNKLESISSLEKCGELRYLNITRNRISEISVLQKMPRLVQLRAAQNRLGLREIDVLKCLIYMSHLRITPNPSTEIAFSRSMLIFTLPQIRYLDKELILPKEIVEANNIFKPTFDKIAFEDQRNTMLERAAQSAQTLFHEFAEMQPLPPLIFLVGTAKSRAEDLAVHLKGKFHHRILLGGVHSTGTTIEFGNHHEDIPISLENFVEMKKRGHLFSTATVLGRLCGFFATQFIKAVEHGALLLAISIPLETAITLRKWGFKATTVLLAPSDSPHFNVDAFLAKEKRRQSLHLPAEDTPKIHGNRKISFAGDAASTDQLPEQRRGSHAHSILKHAEEGESLLSAKPSEGFDFEFPGPFQEQLSDDPVVDADTEIGALELDEWGGEDRGQRSVAVLESVKAGAEGTLSLFGVEIMSPGTIAGIDWKRTILWSDFYEAILTMDEGLHFVVTRHSEDPSILLSREILEKTIAALGYNLVHGPTPLYVQPQPPGDAGDESGPINYQLIVVKQKTSSASSATQSCIDLSDHSEDAFNSLFCEETGEAGEGYSPYLRPASPWYQRFSDCEGEGGFAGEAYACAADPPEEESKEDEVEERCKAHQNKFKHRDALEFSILRTRDEYLKYHLENPGFFATVLDTRDLEGSQKCLEEIVRQALEDLEQDETNSKLYPLVESYAQLCAKADSEVFIADRLKHIQQSDKEWMRGYSAHAQHFPSGDAVEHSTIYGSSSCPANLLCTNYTKGYAHGHICQLQRAGALRKESEAVRNAALRDNFKGFQTCPPPVTCPEVPISGEEAGEIEFGGESHPRCQCGEQCFCQLPKRKESYATFRSKSILTEFGYDGDA